MAALKPTTSQKPSAMPDSIDDLIPNATHIRKEAAPKQAEKVDEYARLAAAEAEKWPRHETC